MGRRKNARLDEEEVRVAAESLAKENARLVAEQARLREIDAYLYEEKARLREIAGQLKEKGAWLAEEEARLTQEEARLAALPPGDPAYEQGRELLKHAKQAYNKGVRAFREGKKAQADGRRELHAEREAYTAYTKVLAVDREVLQDKMRDLQKLRTSADQMSLIRYALYQPPSSFTMSTKMRTLRETQETAFYDYRPEFSGPPQQLLASIAHPAFGEFRAALASRPSQPSQEAQDAALRLADILPRGYATERLRREAVWAALQPLFLPFTIMSEMPLYSGSTYPVDGVIMPDEGTLLALFEVKNEESASYFQAQVYYSQRLNNATDWAGINPALMVEICGPSLRISALFTAGPLLCGDVKAIVCEPLTPHQHFFFMPYDHQHMLTLAVTLDALKACVAKIYQDKRQGALWEQPWVQPYPIPYPLCDGTKYTSVKHVPGIRYIYTAVLHQPRGEPPELEGDAGKPSCRVPSAVSSTQISRGARDAEGVAAPQPASESGSRKAVLVKYTAYVEYGEAAHSMLAQQGLAPALHSCTRLPGGMLEVVMDYLDPEEGWTSLDALLKGSDPQAKLQAQAAVRAAVQRMHAVVIMDPATGKQGPVAHGDLRTANVMLRKGSASGSWSDAQVFFVDFDWACVDGVGVYPAFLNHDLGRPPGVAEWQPIRQEHDIAFLEHGMDSAGTTRHPARQPAAHPANTAAQSRQSPRTPAQPSAAAMRRQPEAGHLTAAAGVGMSVCPRRALPVLRSCAPALLRPGLRAAAQASKPRPAAGSWHGA